MRVSGCPVYYLKFIHGLPLCESLDIGCVQLLALLAHIFFSPPKFRSGSVPFSVGTLDTHPRGKLAGYV
jgi:hypothetical protein